MMLVMGDGHFGGVVRCGANVAPSQWDALSYAAVDGRSEGMA